MGSFLISSTVLVEVSPQMHPVRDTHTQRNIWESHSSSPAEIIWGFVSTPSKH